MRRKAYYSLVPRAFTEHNCVCRGLARVQSSCDCFPTASLVPRPIRNRMGLGTRLPYSWIIEILNLASVATCMVLRVPWANHGTHPGFVPWVLSSWHALDSNVLQMQVLLKGLFLDHYNNLWGLSPVYRLSMQWMHWACYSSLWKHLGYFNHMLVISVACLLCVCDTLQTSKGCFLFESKLIYVQLRSFSLN